MNRTWTVEPKLETVKAANGPMKQEWWSARRSDGKWFHLPCGKVGKEVALEDMNKFLSPDCICFTPNQTCPVHPSFVCE